MKQQATKVGLAEILRPLSRPETVDPEKIYNALGCRWYAGGLYIKESKPGAQFQANKLYRVEEGDFVYNRLFAWKGSFAVATKADHGCYVSNEFPSFTVNRERADSQYLRWYFTISSVWDEALSLSSGGTAISRNRLKEEKFLGLTIPLPPLEEQRRIVARIEELAAKTEEARGLRQKAVAEVDLLTRRQLSETFNQLASDYGQTDFSELIGEAGYGTSVRCDYERVQNAIPVLRIPNIASERVHLGDLKYGLIPGSESTRTVVSAGDILIVRTNGSAELIGRCAVVPQTPEPTAFASYLIRLRPNKEKADSNYMQWALRHLRLDGQLFDLARTTAGQYNVSLGRLYAARIPLPALEEQRRIVAYLDNLQSKVDALKRLQAETAAELDALLPSVLDRAFRGEL